MHGGLAHMCLVCGSRIKIRVWLIYFMWAVLRFGQDAWLCLCFEMNTMCVQAIVFRAARDAYFLMKAIFGRSYSYTMYEN